MINLKNLAGLLLLAGFALNSHAQTASFNGWLATFHTYRLNKKFDVVFDGQIRSTRQVKQVSIILLRPGINFKFNSHVSAAVGYALNDNRRAIGNASALVPEHRIWQQARLQYKVRSASVTHRFRFEERFLPKTYVQNNEVKHKGHNYASRFRYFVRTLVPLKKTTQFNRGVFASLQNEVFLNVGNKTAVNKRVFDQNRLYGAVGYRLSKKLDAEAGYMNQYIIAANGGVINNHILQIATYVNL